MTTNDTFGRQLSDWLRESSDLRVSDHLEEVLVQTVATRQRPWWSSPERWLPMDSILARRVSNQRPILLLVLVATLLLAAVVGLLLVVGSRHALPVLGPASNGRILVSVDGSLRSYAADGSDARTLSAAVQRGSEAELAISPDGTRLAYQPAGDPGRVDVMAFADGSIAKIQLPSGATAVEPFSWSADGRSLVFVGIAEDKTDVYVAAADGSSVKPVGQAQIGNLHVFVSRPAVSPDGKWILFTGRTIFGPEPGNLYLIGVDGSGFERVSQDPWNLGELYGASPYGVPSWAPTAAADRLVYFQTTDGNGGGEIRIHTVGQDADQSVASGRWPTWSPDGSHLAYWDNGTIVVPVPDSGVITGGVHPFQGTKGSCDRHAVLDGNPVCGPVTWSPDGKRVVGYDESDHGLLIANADGSGSLTRVDVGGAKEVRLGWQPVRP